MGRNLLISRCAAGAKQMGSARGSSGDRRVIGSVAAPMFVAAREMPVNSSTGAQRDQWRGIPYLIADGHNAASRAASHANQFPKEQVSAVVQPGVAWSHLNSEVVGMRKTRRVMYQHQRRARTA